MTYRVEEFVQSDRAELGESTLPFELFSFVLESERCGCQQRNAVNGKGRKGKGDQTSTAEQYLRQNHSTRRKFCNRFSELLEASTVQPKVVECVHLEILKTS